MTKKEKIIERILKAVDRTAPNSEVFLFGSHAKGSYHKLSDWDLLILLNADKLPFELETDFMDQLYEVELDTGEIISPLIYTKSDWLENRAATPLYENIEREGVKIK